MKRLLLCMLAFLFFCHAFSPAEALSETPEPNAVRDSACAEIAAVIAEGNRNIEGTCRKFDNGETPVILFIDGSGNRSGDAALFRYEELARYNLYCFNSTSPDGNSFNIVNYRKAEDLRTGYADVVIREVLKAFPEAERIGIVSYSAGGYAANAVCKAAKENGLTVCWTAGYDNVVRKEKAYLTFSDYIKTNGIPSMLAVSTDRNVRIALNSVRELTENGADYAVVKRYDSTHGNLMDAEGVSGDLAEFAEKYFAGMNDSEDAVSPDILPGA